MKIYSKILLLIIISFSFFNASHSDRKDIFDINWTRIPYCHDDDECWLEEWIDVVEHSLDDIETERSASEYIQDIVKFLLWFIYLVAVILVIYAWFNLFTWLWDEEKAKKSKTMIIYVIVWILIIFLAGPIVEFVLNVLNTWT